MGQYVGFLTVLEDGFDVIQSGKEAIFANSYLMNRLQKAQWLLDYVLEDGVPRPDRPYYWERTSSYIRSKLPGQERTCVALLDDISAMLDLMF